MKVATKIKPLLEQEGAEVILTRTVDTTVTRTARSELGRIIKADALISIHANASFRTHASGIEMYLLDTQIKGNGAALFAKNPDDAKLLEMLDAKLENYNKNITHFARAIQSQLVGHLEKNGHSVFDRGVKREGFCLFLHNHLPMLTLSCDAMPVSLVEIGFLTNTQEVVRLEDETYQQLIAEGICNGVVNYFTQLKSETDEVPL